jgi:hypothetical protein
VSPDPVLRFKDSCGNDLVGMDVVDVEALEELLGSVLDVLSSPAVLEELTSSLPAARIEHLVDDLANRLSFVRHLVGAGR